ncbi:hypothetical protein [Metabacillus sp. B2-18]|uniref:hypothetical protein n=1 Tax=Metabacillus sp. B2-18 TaxID=2897333 RepID=UPI001E2E2FEB|nr:hypothetical protein [Metabacillus sp. B2-18]UGB33135.1 hypothetical protein LPC09_12260 [Metabacillus sp. B2-18]
MLSFEHKKTIFSSYNELFEKSISNDRVDYVYPGSLQRGKTLATQLHPSGNGYVIGKYMDSDMIFTKGYKVDNQGWIKIKDYSVEELHEIIIDAMKSMSNKDIKAHSYNRPNEIKYIRSFNENVDSQTKSEKVSLELVQSCLYNWLGYGNINASTWFIGIEEGGAEIWRNKTKTLEQSLELRKRYKSQMDFRYVWEELYNIPLESFSGPNVWRYMVAFLLELEGHKPNTEEIKDYIFYSKQFGREDSNHFLCELMPLPKQSKGNIDPYKSIWSTVEDYYKEVGEKRFSLIKDAIIQSTNVGLIVSYDRTLTEKMVNFFSSVIETIDNWKFAHEEYTLFKVTLHNNREIFLLSTPFFGNGRISYEGIRKAVERVRSLRI